MTTPDPTKPWAGYIQDQQYTAFQDRMIQIGKVNHQATVSGLNTRNGVFLGGGDGNSNINLNVRSNGGMNLLIDAGSAIIDGYSVINPIQAALTIAPSTSTARRDAVILRVYDTEAGDAVSKTQLEIVKGTTTSDPPLPARCLLLAVVDVAANAVSVTPSDRRKFTTSVGGVVPYYGTRPDITTIANGQIVHSLDTMQNDQRDGDNYYPLGANYNNHVYYSTATAEIIGVGVWAYKNAYINLSRVANLVLIHCTINFHQQDPNLSSVCEWGWDWDGAGGLLQTINNGSTYQYGRSMMHSAFGVVSRAAAGQHQITAHIKPTLGNGIEATNWTITAIALS